MCFCVFVNARKQKSLILAVLLAVALTILSGCELTVSSTKTEYDPDTNTIRRTTAILPDLEEQLNSLLK